MCLRKTSTINVYINVIYKLNIYYSVYRSKEILQITIIEINYQRFVNEFINDFVNDFINDFANDFINDFATICQRVY